MHREFLRLRRLRRLLPTADAQPEKVLAAAERTARPIRAVGFFLP